MTASPAELPPTGLVGLNPAWSRLVTCADHSGVERTWHLLDNGVGDPRLTLLCVHGNPSWSYLWRDVLAGAPSGVRVVAVDQLEMGYSERSATKRRLADRIDDLDLLTHQLGIDGPVATIAHDWGGPISVGWGLGHIGQLVGLVLLNTAVHQPPASPTPALIKMVRRGPILDRATVQTAAFVKGAVALSKPRLGSEVRKALLAPYGSAVRRQGIGDFVEDIPLDASHRSFDKLREVAEGMSQLGEVPSLLLWGPNDPVFSDLYLHDLEERLPHADVHRFVGASHFVSEDAPAAEAIIAWIEQLGLPTKVPIDGDETQRDELWAAIDRLGQTDRTAVTERFGDEVKSISFRDLKSRVDRLVRGLNRHGVQPGDRVAVLVPPGIDLSVSINACFRLGAVLVLVDSGLGPTNMSRALRSANPKYLIGVTKALVAARALRWPGEPISVEDLGGVQRNALGATTTLGELDKAGATGSLPEAPGDDREAAVVFTSGSTGPSKGVVYLHRQLQAQRDILADLYNIGPDDRLVAAFAPFALYGPALGIHSTVPEMDVAKPGTLTAGILATAVADIDATMVFASPAALRNVVATAHLLGDRGRQSLADLRLLLSAGAPINPSVLEAAQALMGNASTNTPYGMTEVLPVSNISLEELRSLSPDNSPIGTCVGQPHRSVQVRIDSLGGGDEGAGAPGEVLVRADHVKERYDRLWFTEYRSSQPPGWHRTGDVGSVDVEGRLWISGRIGDVIRSDAGLLTPVPIELAAESVAGVGRAAAVAIGPPGTQVVAIVIESGARERRSISGGGLALTVLTVEVRTAVEARTGVSIAAVLEVDNLPVDRRHNSKIDRPRLAEWASGLLAGDRPSRP